MLLSITLFQLANQVCANVNNPLSGLDTLTTVYKQLKWTFEKHTNKTNSLNFKFFEELCNYSILKSTFQVK